MRHSFATDYCEVMVTRDGGYAVLPPTIKSKLKEQLFTWFALTGRTPKCTANLFGWGILGIPSHNIIVGGKPKKFLNEQIYLGVFAPSAIKHTKSWKGILDTPLPF